MDGSALDTPPLLVKRKGFYFPDHLTHNQNHPTGRVVARVGLDAAGHMVDVKVLWASHPAFIPPTVNQLIESQFSPARKNGVPVPCTAEFDTIYEVHGYAGYAPYEFAGFPGKIKGASPEYDWDVPAALERYCEPVYPLALFEKKIKGQATVRLIVDEKGDVASAEVRTATDPLFGAAFVAAAETWHFLAADRGNKKTKSLAEYTYTFSPAGTHRSKAEIDSVKELLDGGSKFAAPGAVDQRLHPVYQVAPQYPRALLATKPRGEAQVEFIIYNDCSVVLPNVVSASQPEFGQAAMIAVQQWAFLPPTVKGQPVSVRARLSFDFAP